MHKEYGLDGYCIPYEDFIFVYIFRTSFKQANVAFT